MFERFTEEARQVVVSSQDEARQLHHNFIGTEHLLLGLLDQTGSPTRAVFERHGLTRTAALSAPPVRRSTSSSMRRPSARSASTSTPSGTASRRRSDRVRSTSRVPTRGAR